MNSFLIRNKTITMSVHEFMQYSNNEITLKDILTKQQAEKIMNTMITNKMFEKFAIVFIACTLLVCKSVSANADLSKVNQAGSTLLMVVRTFGYWVCLIMGIVEVIRSLLNGDTKSIAKITAKYLLGFSSFYALPWLMDIIKGIFE